MAKALQCPSCGRKHPVSTLPQTATFACSGCGQSLKVPAQFRQPTGSDRVQPAAAPRSAPARPAPERTRVMPAGAPPVAAPPIERRRPPTRPAPVPPPVPRNGDAAGEQPRRAPAQSAGPSALARLGGMPLRLLAWVVAIALGGVLTVYVARKTGWLSGQRLVDVFTGTGWSRYLRVMAIVPVWAIVTTVLVTIFVEGGRWLARARATAHAERASAASAAD
jgi:hypothetical protein